MNTNNIIIRVAKESDYEEVNKHYRNRYSIYSEKLPQIYKKPPIKALPKGTYLNMLDDTNSLILLAEIDGAVAGIICAEIENEEGDNWMLPRSWASITELIVPSNPKGATIEKVLLQETEKWAKQRGVNEITTLIYSYEKSENGLFRKNGYKPINTRMKKDL